MLLVETTDQRQQDLSKHPRVLLVSYCSYVGQESLVCCVLLNHGVVDCCVSPAQLGSCSGC